ncbi:hypothetical protein [Flexivirga sp. B27]
MISGIITIARHPVVQQVATQIVITVANQIAEIATKNAARRAQGTA